MQKRKVLYAVLGVVGLLTILVVGVGAVYAQGPRPPVDATRDEECSCGEEGGYGRGRWMRDGQERGMRGESLVEVTAEVTGLSKEEVVAALESGQTFAQIAEAQGVDPQAIVDAFIAEREEMLKEAVAEGRLTQEQADQMLDEMTEHLSERLDEPWTPFGGTEGWEGRGRMGRSGFECGQRPGAGFPARFFPHR
ncbi:MAG TPA: hypothetical protein G4O00_14950 [Thermoflexia bacterium]|jgi:hypothetical protein|nr:hypothetical protein [Thermoflexia bacterium]